MLYRISDAAEWRTMKSSSADMALTINNLVPGTEYEFMVLSQDRFGDGMFSKSYKFTTNGMVFYGFIFIEYLILFIEIVFFLFLI